MTELIQLMDTAEYDSPDYVGLANVFRDYNLSGNDDPEAVLEFVSVSSEFYRELDAYYREDARDGPQRSGSRSDRRQGAAY